METIFSEQHRLRDANTEFFGGELIAPHEKPSRAEYVLDRVKNRRLGKISAPQDFGLAPIHAIHDAGFVRFLQTIWEEWTAEGFKGEAMPTALPVRRMAQTCPNFVEGKLGFYANSVETSLTQGTWQAAYASAQVALTGASRLQTGSSAVFSLCRPPGHHAFSDSYGGFCFLNNAAIAAQSMLDNGAKRVAILDVDFHHGNGTQDIFYDRNDVLFVSLHGDPMETFPYFLGHADETGIGVGEDYNLNIPMPAGTPFEIWREALQIGLEKVRNFGAEALIISLGVDTFENDPISFFKLMSDDFLTMGEDIAKMGMPTQFVMEGGYDVEEIGVNAVNVLEGFEQITG
ncbi:histone deacetylase family protein [Shimia sp. R11_0]|uniref:histone deacetylase family protein n=1 Tax=Shimia sp. R11_0 TaxID=2821096 RepID=UPI001ADBD59A|nr:histone deacetylase family protein [Shimia sp. R11_0]MBO9479338.1 histone deacetylase family protein [Shimia sp. R11_0]